MKNNNQSSANKTIVIDSVPDDPTIRFETSKLGLQAWSVPIPGTDANVVGMKWKEVEKALVQAIESGHYTPEKITLK